VLGSYVGAWEPEDKSLYKMSKIKIENFGPIKQGYQHNDGWIDLKKTTVFIGNQGSGKSTVAKLISTFLWIEKALVRGDYDEKWFKSRFELKNQERNQYLTYHRLENYVNAATKIEYHGHAYAIKYEDSGLVIDKTDNTYPLPQILYVPAERNFIAYVKTPKDLNLSSGALKEFLTEFDNAKNNIKKVVTLPINNVNLEYNKRYDSLYLTGHDYRLKLTEASSGFQSVVPLYLVSEYLAQSVKNWNNAESMTGNELIRFKKGVEAIWKNSDLTDEQKSIAISALSSKFNKTAFINIIEEPEQNLFPSSQWHILQSLLEFNNFSSNNQLIITTHSPFIINYLSIAIQAGTLKNKIDASSKTEALMVKLNKIISEKSLVYSDSVAVYQFKEIDGSIAILPSFEGIPADTNYLNESLRACNQLFDLLLEIEEEL